MAREINVRALTTSILELYELYQRLEVTDEVSETNPAFDFICDIVDGLFNSCMDLMSLTYAHPEANEKMVTYYKDMITEMENHFNCADCFPDEDDFFEDDNPLFE